MRIDQGPIAIGTTVHNTPEKIDEVARQLEGQFAQMLIKSMRDASFGDALFPGENQLYRELYDQQLAKALTSGKGLGLAAMISRQLGGDAATSVTDLNEQRVKHAPTPVIGFVHSPQTHAQTAHTPAVHSAEGFVANIWQHAQQAARELGVNVRALIAQAALETGWGKHGIKRETGANSHNLFGIKATGWRGESATANTHEYRNGLRQNERAAFRAYHSVAESFSDYVKLLKQNPRYRAALRAGDNVHQFASALQNAGYATDPNYAEKINAIANGPMLKGILAKITGQ